MQDAQPQLRARLSRSIGSTKGSHVILFTASKWRTRHRHQKISCRGRAGLDEGLPFVGTEGDALVAEELSCVAGAEQRATGIWHNVLSTRRIAVTGMILTAVLRGNPLEVVEHMATSHSWQFERACEDEL